MSEEQWYQRLQGDFAVYMTDCYGGPLPEGNQAREIEQAFLSGVHWLNALRGAGHERTLGRARPHPHDPALEGALRRRLREIGSLH